MQGYTKKKRETIKKEEKLNSDKEIKDEHYDEVDKELRKNTMKNLNQIRMTKM